MNLLDRHIFKSVLFSCAAAVGLFAFVLILGNAVKDLLGYVLADQLSLGTFARLVGLLVPFVISASLLTGDLDLAFFFAGSSAFTTDKSSTGCA